MSSPTLGRKRASRTNPKSQPADKKSAAQTKKERATGAASATVSESKDEDSALTTTTVPSERREASADVVTTQQEDKQVDSIQSTPQLIPLSRIVLPKSQKRRYFDQKAMESLAESVKREGILQPILLRPQGDSYELVAGERRYKAATVALLTEIPAIVREMSDTQAMEYAIAENLQREDLNPVEETEAILDLLALKLETNRERVIALLNTLSRIQRGKGTDNDVRPEDKQTIEEVFQTIGKISPEAFRVHRLPLLNLPDDILEALRAGKIEYTKAREIAKLKSESDRMQLLEDAIDMSLSFSEIHKQVLAKKPLAELHSLQTRLETVYKNARKSKVWEQPDKQKKLESLLAELEALLSNEGN